MAHPAASGFGWPALVAIAVIAAGAVLAVQALFDKPPIDAATAVAPIVIARMAAPASAAVEPAVAPGPRDDALAAQRVIELRSVLEARFVSDTLDPEWSAQAETAVFAAAAEPALEPFGTPLDLRAACTGHMCRIEIDFDNAMSAADWASFYPTSLAPTLSAVHATVEPLPDRGARVVVIGARTGFNQLMAPPPGNPGRPAATALPD